MPHRLFLPALFCFSAAALSSSPSAATPLPGQVGLYGDPQGNSRIALFPAFQPFEVYLLMFDPPEGIKGWEAHIELPADFVLHSIEFDHPNTLNLGPLTGDQLNCIVGMASGCNYSPTEPIRLATIRMVYLGSEPHPFADLCLQAATPSSLNPPVPLLASCTSQLMPFDLVDDVSWLDPGCVRLEYGDICPPVELPSTTRANLLDAAGMPGELAELPLTAYTRQCIIDCCFEVQELTHMVLALEWDMPELATLEDVQPVGLLADWSSTIVASNAGNAIVHLDGGTPAVFDQTGPDNPTEIARLLFRLGPNEGATTVELTAFEVYGLPGLTPYPAGFAGGGDAILTSGPVVSVDAKSLGSLKAWFEGSQ